MITRAFVEVRIEHEVGSTVVRAQLFQRLHHNLVPTWLPADPSGRGKIVGVDVLMLVPEAGNNTSS